MRLESIARTRGDENPTAKGRSEDVHPQGEQQALKPIPKAPSLAKKMNCGRSAIQTVLNRIRNGPALEKGRTGNVLCQVRNQ